MIWIGRSWDFNHSKGVWLSMEVYLFRRAMRDSVDGSTKDEKLRVNQLKLHWVNVGQNGVPYNALHQMIGHFSRNNMHVKLWQVLKSGQREEMGPYHSSQIVCSAIKMGDSTNVTGRVNGNRQNSLNTLFRSMWYFNHSFSKTTFVTCKICPFDKQHTLLQNSWRKKY